MALLKDLCRLCARKHEYSKDLLDKNNKSTVDLIRHFTQITVIECENMPTKICLDCEEKLVTFQLFILECYKIQDSLRQLCLEESSLAVKQEANRPMPLAIVKSEVKEEVPAVDIMYAMNHPLNIAELSASDLAHDMSNLGNIRDQDQLQHDQYDLDDEIAGDNDNYEAEDGVDDGPEDDVLGADNGVDDDALENLSIASLQELKKKTSEEAIANLVSRKNCRPKDFVKMRCLLCMVKFKKWKWAMIASHYYQAHQRKPMVHCLCGFPIKSLSGLYKHTAEHMGRNKTDDDDGTLGKIKGIKVNDFVDFKCEDCQRLFSSWYKLAAHTQRAHKISAPVVQCRCGLLLKSKSCLYKHISDHKTISTWSCDQCALVTKSEESLKKHKLRHVPKEERRFKCSQCDKEYSTKDACRSHERKHIPIEQRQVYQCDQCELKFTTRASATTHKRVIHEKVKSYICDLCGYACGTSGELRQHRAIHSDDKPFVCSKCSKPFKTYSNLKTHMDTHEDTSYSCFVCSRVLNSRRTLRKHLLVHEDKCRHVCSYCNKAFKRRQTLKVHLYTHTGDKPLTCKWCGDRFAYASTLRSHRLRCHPDKMTQPHSYSYVLQEQQEYIKNNLPASEMDRAVEKHEVEAMS